MCEYCAESSVRKPIYDLVEPDYYGNRRMTLRIGQGKRFPQIEAEAFSSQRYEHHFSVDIS